MAQNEPQHKETPPGPSPNSPSLLFEYQCTSRKCIKLANRIQSNRNFFPELECSSTKRKLHKIAYSPLDSAQLATNKTIACWRQSCIRYCMRRAGWRGDALPRALLGIRRSRARLATTAIQRPAGAAYWLAAFVA